jgi:hypothetical protein
MLFCHKKMACNSCFYNSEKISPKTVGRNEKSVFLQPSKETLNMAVVAQLVRVPDCGSVGRRFESDLPPKKMLP